MDRFNEILGSINDVLWHDFVLFVVLAVGALLIVWSKFGPLVALTHGIQVVRGKYDSDQDPGAINHFQALSAALSATIGLGNIGGVAVAISLGGPGAVFWMWMVGIAGMALKMTEVTQSMLYRNTLDPENPHGGPMFVASHGMAEIAPSLAGLGRWIGYIFCATLMVSTVTGGNMFQAWNVGNVTELNFGVPELLTGFILAVITGLVIIGGIKRIGAVAGKLVPFMCVIYLVAAIYVLIVNFDQIPSMFRLIFVSAFSPTEAQGAFIGGTFGYAFLWGMKRALFSNEAGQGSAPIAHAAAKTDEPVREGIVAGIGPFVDTIIICTLTALVILSSGAWNRGAEGIYDAPPAVVASGPGEWTITSSTLPPNTVTAWQVRQNVFMLIDTGVLNEETGYAIAQVNGVVDEVDGVFSVTWNTFASERAPELHDPGVYVVYTGASLTSHAFDRVQSGLGRWLVTFAAWLFAISTMISWSYYGEQGIVFMLGAKWVRAYKLAYCFLILVATSGFITTDAELDGLTGVGTGVMLFANIPIILIFSRKAMREYHAYMRRLRSGEMLPDR
jgi:AGCS family alanine or glycine:cation symporter